MRHARTVYSAPQNVLSEAVGWDMRVRPVSKLRVNGEGIKEIHVGYTFGNGYVQRMEKSALAVPEPERHIVPYFRKDKTSVSVETTDRYVWEFGGERFEESVRTEDFFRGRPCPVSRRNYVEIVLNADDPAHAVKYDFDISGAVHVTRSRGYIDEVEKVDRGAWSSSDGMLFGSNDVQEVTTRVPSWGERVSCTMEDVPDEVRRSPEWAGLEDVVRNGGKEYRDRADLKWRQSKWECVCAEAREHLDRLAEAGIETTLEDKMRDCGAGLAKGLTDRGYVENLHSGMSEVDFYRCLHEYMAPEPRILTREMLDWCLHRAAPKERERYGNCVGPEFDELERLVVEGAWNELLRMYPNRFAEQGLEEEVCGPAR